MKLELTAAECRALAAVAAWVLDPETDPLTVDDIADLDSALVTAWLKLVRAQAQQVAVPTPDAASLPVHSLPGVGTADDRNDAHWGFR